MKSSRLEKDKKNQKITFFFWTKKRTVNQLKIKQLEILETNKSKQIFGVIILLNKIVTVIEIKHYQLNNVLTKLDHI